MVAVGEYLVLMRQVRPAAVNQINTWQAVGLGNFLRTQMLFDGHWVISATLHRSVVTDDHALAAGNAANTSDQASAGDFATIKIAGRKLANFKER